MPKLLDKLVQRFIPDADVHLSNETIADLFCDELSFRRSVAVKSHLRHCAECRQQREHLEGTAADEVLRIYSESLGAIETRLPLRSRTVFAAWLELQFRPKSPSRASWTLFRPMPALSAGLALGMAIGGAALWWMQGASMSANSFLVRAEKWDTASTTAAPDVARQTVRITTAKEKFQRSIYWDIQGKRRPRPLKLAANSELLRTQLSNAGVDWEQPISASTYQSWHDQQHIRNDRITRSGLHLLTLTTTVPNGVVSAESLTVRDSDFHPILRTVDFRNSGTVEIAEVDFNIIPWASVDPGIFEPIGGLAHTAALSPSIPVPSKPAFATRIPLDDEMDETELAARLVLNQLHADTGEQIEVRRSAEHVEVAGLVQTDQRKRELTDQLAKIPGLHVSLQSVSDLAKNPAPAIQAIAVQSASLPDNPSALETYLRARGTSVESVNASAQQLFSVALRISQESRAIEELQRRFDPSRDLPVIASATLADLLYSHRERLEEDVRQERRLLASIMSTSRANETVGNVTSNALVREADRNLSLSRELTQTNAPALRSAEEIFTDMSTTVDTLAAAAHQGYASSRMDSLPSQPQSEER